MPLSTDIGNRVRWSQGLRGHVESYFLKLNDPAQRFALWLKFTFHAPWQSQSQAEVWAVWFDMDNPALTRAWKTALPLTDAVIVDPDLHLRVGVCELTDGKTSGSLGDPSRPDESIEWDLSFTPGEAPLQHLPWAWMYEHKLPKSKIVAPHPASRFSGSVCVNGRQLHISNAVGTQGHNWGAEHAWQYAWGHCALFDGHGDDTFFEGFSTRLKLGPWVTPISSIAHLSLDGRRHAFDRWRSMSSRPVSIEHQRWTFRLENRDYALSGVIEAPREDFICLHYRNPDESIAYCLNSKLASAELRLLDRHERVVAHLVSPRGAALEVLTRDADHGVRFGA